MGMPVILHMIAGTMGGLMVKGNREIKGALLGSFLIINILQWLGSSNKKSEYSTVFFYYITFVFIWHYI